MKKIVKYIAIVLLICSCQKEKYEISDMKISVDQITRIVLRSDHKTIIPNEISKMDFYPIVYATRSVKSYSTDPDTGEYVEGEIVEEFLVPNDQVPAGAIKVYDGNGIELKDRTYSALGVAPGTEIDFVAKCGALESEKLKITVREIPVEPIEELVIPVIFHLLIEPKYTGPTYDVSTEYLRSQLKRAEDVFNAKITSDPNAGKVKIRFELAKYNASGVLLPEPGKDVYNLSQADIDLIGPGTGATKNRIAGYAKFILSSNSIKTALLWRPDRFLNIWLASLNNNTTSTSSTFSAKANPPKYILEGSDPDLLPGLDLTPIKAPPALGKITSCYEGGFFVNYVSFFKPSMQGANDYSIVTTFGQHFGLLATNCSDPEELNEDGDNDYCADTYTYDSDLSPLIRKSNRLYGQEEEDPTLEYFSSFNIMDEFSKKNSVTADQAARVRLALEQCPSLWCYKSKFALTGK